MSTVNPFHVIKPTLHNSAEPVLFLKLPILKIPLKPVQLLLLADRYLVLQSHLLYLNNRCHYL